MAARLPGSQIHFLSLETAILCVQCELISGNTTPSCPACGSKAVLSLSRLFAGSLRSQPRARVIHDDELNCMVRGLLSTGPGAWLPSGECEAMSRNREGQAFDPGTNSDGGFPVPNFDLDPAISTITEQAQTLTGATGAAIALCSGSEVVWRARAGRTAPDVGIRLETDCGVSAECLRRGEVVLSNDAEDDFQVDLPSCRGFGVRSILAAPLRQFRRTLGIFEVLSSFPNAFDEQHVTTMQLLASMVVVAISRFSGPRATQSRDDPRLRTFRDLSSSGPQVR
ncbi:MAG: GAF domain-containing protein [Acidobacteria bacterium]|nr:GAF domain-containing protein [Acidobacteriota bacterium]